MSVEDLKIYLPKFLSDPSSDELFSGLKDFPKNIDERVYTNYLDKDQVIYQGDGLNDMLVVNLPDTEFKPTPSIVLSNTCDIDLMNSREYPSQIIYAPILNLDKYHQAIALKTKKSEKQIIDHIQNIKKQRETQIFYLPKYGNLDESIVFLDRIHNYPNKLIDRNNLEQRRIFSLSDYGAYLFILKLSIHFTRIQDKVERKSVKI